MEEENRHKVEKDSVRKAIFELLDKDPSLIDKLKYLLEMEKLNPAGNIATNNSPSEKGWEIEDQNLPPKDIEMMFKHGLVIRFFKTSNFKFYCVNPVVVDVLDEMEESGLTSDIEVVQSNEIPEDLFDVIIGHDEIKEFLKAAIHSTKPVHVLLVGPPATAKTVFLMEIEKLPGAKYAIGSTASKAGLRDQLLAEDIKYLLIDEIEKMKNEDRDVLLSLMETGRVSVTKKKMNMEVHRDTKVFAAANRIDKVLPELLDRFMVLTLPDYKEGETAKILSNVLGREIPNDVEKRKEIIETIVEIVDRAKGFIGIRDAIKLARMSKSPEEAARLAEILLKYTK